MVGRAMAPSDQDVPGRRFAPLRDTARMEGSKNPQVLNCWL